MLRSLKPSGSIYIVNARAFLSLRNALAYANFLVDGFEPISKQVANALLELTADHVNRYCVLRGKSHAIDLKIMALFDGADNA